MTKKKPVIDKPNRIQINQTRQAGKVNKTSLFDNIQLRHPYEDIFAAPTDNVKPSFAIDTDDRKTLSEPDSSSSEQNISLKNSLPIYTGLPTQNEPIHPAAKSNSKPNGQPKINGMPNNTGNPKSRGIPKTDGVPAQDIYPISPARDFTKTPNSITRYILAHGLFKGKSKQVYDYLWSESRGNIKLSRTAQRTNKQIKDGTGLGSKNTVADALKHLGEIGLIIKTTTAGERTGNIYEVLTPEEVGYPNLLGIPSQIGIPDEAGIPTRKPGYPGIPEIGMPSKSEAIAESTSYDDSKTSFKDINTNDDEAFADFIGKFQELAKEVCGRKLAKGETENFGRLADLLILEFRIAARRTNNVSSIPAFLTEVLRRKLRESFKPAKPAKFPANKAVGSLAINSNAVSYEVKSLDETGRKAALEQLQEFADDEFLQDFKKWYTEDDWNWLINQLTK